ncbi:nitroreductase family deazaflavin-dependent oxidoreductase [Actinomycetospora lutea]|uniref:nitroreductase family deazaflavin-dependent oxidoreductase n=1 Tax=Actinomycetospora lutea TaxID=663604 RepID=UPI00236655F7|nr:nitroreductase family deazaflavin-dependent oxidoreductase [Actinomycetospora lutea]MDD7939622.1 nitroreductase family deazaflavin-dependent oxidoreductase [Actinomycetospora lutea]
MVPSDDGGPRSRGDQDGAARRRRRTRLLQRYVLNPPVRLATRCGWVPGHVLVETVGRTTGRPRRTVVGAELEGDTVWIVAEQGPYAGYVRNLVTEPRVRLCLDGCWYDGVARLAPEVDPERLLARWDRPVHAAGVRRFGTALRVVRVDLEAHPTGRAPGARHGGRLRRWWYRGRRPHWTARLLNRLSAAQFAAGVLSPARAVTLEVRGRRSGRTVSLPVVVADHDGQRYLVAMLGERAQWVQNVRAAGGRAVLRRRGREEVRLEEIEPGERGPVLRRYLALAPGARAHVPVDRRAPLEEFERIAPSFPVFRVVPVPPEER